MQQRIRSSGEKLFPWLPNTLVTLTLPYPLVTFRFENFAFMAPQRSFDRRGNAWRSFSGGNMKKTGLLVVLLATACWAQSGDSGDGAAAIAEVPQGTAPTTASFPTE